MRINSICVAVLAVLLQSATIFAGTHRETIEKTFEISEGGEVILSNTNGKVTIETWDFDKVRVKAVKEVRASGRREAEELLRKLEVEMRQSGNRLEITTSFPRRRGGFWSKLFNNNGAQVSYSVTVPRRMNMDVETVNGKVTVSDVIGRQRYKSTNGAIRVLESWGSVSARTTNGSILAELNEVQDDDMSFKTTNGSIEVSLPSAIQVDIDARTTNGSVKSEFPIKVDGNMSRKRLRGKINGGGSYITLKTTNGGIRILER